jgi:myo-inositol-1-phosphate synthase
VAQVLRDSGADVLVNYLPVGSEDAVRWYMEQALEAGVAVVNAMPVFIASDPEWQQRFFDAGLPIIGDDIKSQVGSTITHRILTRLFEDRGVRIDRTYQLNFGGNTDFLNMLERSRLISKKISKTQAVTSQVSDSELTSENIHVGPSDYIAWLQDRKWAHIRIEGTTFGNVPLNMELKLEVWDSPNSAGVIIDAVRCAKLGLDRGLKGALVAPSAYLKKSPPIQFTDDVAHKNLEAYIAGENSQTLPPMPEAAAEEELELAVRFREQGDLEAARQLVLSHLRFVVYTDALDSYYYVYTFRTVAYGVYAGV